MGKVASRWCIFVFILVFGELWYSCKDSPTSSDETGTHVIADIQGDDRPDNQKADMDGDNIPNTKDPDMDGDGLLNAEDPDIDDDGIPNASDADMDGDGIPNINDPDIDGDLLLNADDPDVDADGIANKEDRSIGENTLTNIGLPIAPGDIDLDGLPNNMDPDMDGDGKPNGEDPDADNDLVLDVQDTLIGDYTTPASALKAVTLKGDLDGDGELNSTDPDMDGDGLPNTVDPDIDGDGTPNESDKVLGNITLPNPDSRIEPGDLDKDGFANQADTDMDGDGIPNALDPDIDNDGIPSDLDTLLGNIREQSSVTVISTRSPVSSQCFFGDPKDTQLGDNVPFVKILQREKGDDIEFVVIFTPHFVDNSYGKNSVGWKRPRGHTFKDLYRSDHVELSLLNGQGEEAFHLKLDLISKSSSAPSGWASLGPFGGDGELTVGAREDVVSYSSSLDDNLNKHGYGLLRDSPETDADYTPNPEYPNWDFNVVYRLTVRKSAFGASGFGKADMTSVHASPAKTPVETVTVTEDKCPPTEGETDVFKRTLIYKDTTWVD